SSDLLWNAAEPKAPEHHSRARGNICNRLVCRLNHFIHGSKLLRGGANTPRISHGHLACVEKVKVVMLCRVSPGFNSVVGNEGWFGESGKCCVSKHNAEFFPCPSCAL